MTTSQATRSKLPHDRAADALWDNIVLTRTSGPPLRFKGIELSRLQAPSAAGPLEICLWRRKTPGFVGFMRRAHQADAASCRDLDGIMDWLEAYCATQDWFSSGAPISAHLEQASKLLAAHSAFRRLAGAAMDEWDRMGTNGNMTGRL